MPLGWLVLLFFFFSGTSGLIYEIVWTRLLRHVMGNTVYSMTTALCAFMGGLALGSYIAGRIIDRRRDSLRIYGLIEGAVAVYCFCLPWLIGLTEPIFRYLYQHYHGNESAYGMSLIRFAVSLMILLPAATLMGATLPVLSRFFASSSDRLGSSIGRLYAINTFGAVLGCFGTGFVLIPFLGGMKTLYAACFLNALICACALMLYRRLGDQVASPGSGVNDAEAVDDSRKSKGGVRKSGGGGVSDSGGVSSVGRISYGRWPLRILLVGYGLSGMCSMVYEVAWSRVLSLLIGSSVYAFSLMLTAFILGLALGSAFYARAADRRRDPMLALGVVEILIGVSAVAVIPLFGRLPFFVTGMIARYSHSFFLLQLAEFGLVCVIMMIPAILMGIAFPLVTRLYAQSAEKAGRSVGTVYAWNTLGSIIGAFLGGFVFLRFLGIQNALLSVVLLNCVLGCVFLLLSQTLSRRVGVVVSVLLLGGMAGGYGFLPSWDKARMTFGPFEVAKRFADKATSKSALEEMNALGRVIYHKEGVTTTVTVKEFAGGARALYVNGKPDASTGADMITQSLSGHVPVLLHRDPRDVAVVGLASGVTVGCVGLHPSIERIDCVEISPAVVEACRFFDRVNYNVLDDPRLNLILTDGRNHLNLTDKRYDVIISEPSSPWIAGLGDLFTYEYYKLVSERLKPGGVACCWINSYNIDERGVRSIIHSYHSVFPNMLVWEFDVNDYALIGSLEPFSIGYDEFVRRFNVPKVAADMRRLGLVDAPHLLSHVLFGKKGIEGFTKGAVLHTDDNALLEFLAPRTLHSKDLYASMSALVYQYRDIDLSFLNQSQDDAAKLATVRVRVDEIIDADKLAIVGAELLEEYDLGIAADPNFSFPGINPLQGNGQDAAGATEREKKLGEALSLFVQAIRLDADNADVQSGLADVLVRLGRAEEAVPHYQVAAQLDSETVSRWADLAMALSGLNRIEEEVQALLSVVRLNPGNFEGHYNLGVDLDGLGRVDEAIDHYMEATKIEPERFEPHVNLAGLCQRTARFDEAIKHYRLALSLQPSSLPVQDAISIRMNFGGTLLQNKMFEESAEQFLEVLRLEPRMAVARLWLARIRREQAKPADALKYYRDYITADSQNAEVHCELADLLMHLGDWSGAVSAYRSAVRVNPGMVCAQQGLEAAEKAANSANTAAGDSGGG